MNFYSIFKIVFYIIFSACPILVGMLKQDIIKIKNKDKIINRLLVIWAILTIGMVFNSIHLEKRIEKNKAMAEPNTMMLHSKKIQKIDFGFGLSLCFKSTKNEFLRNLSFIAELPANSKETILSFSVADPEKIGKRLQINGQKDSITSKNGRLAKLSFIQLEDINPIINLVVTGSTTVRISGNHNLKPFEINIK